MMASNRNGSCTKNMRTHWTFASADVKNRPSLHSLLRGTAVLCLDMPERAVGDSATEEEFGDDGTLWIPRGNFESSYMPKRLEK